MLSGHEERQFLAEGAQAVREALAALERRCSSGARALRSPREAADRHPELVALADAAGVPITVASDEVLDALSETVTPQGLVAVVDFLDLGWKR